LLDLAEAGESWAVKELRDTLDGKPPQALEHSGPDGDAIRSIGEILIRGIEPEKAG